MNNPFVVSLTILAALLIAAPAQAQKYGPFQTGDSFTMQVKKVKSTRQVCFSGPEEPFKVHSKAPSFRKGNVLKFRIKSKGRLSAKKIRIPFSDGDRNGAEFNLFRDGPIAVTHNAQIFTRNGKPVKGILSFFITDNSGPEPVFYNVVYTIK